MTIIINTRKVETDKTSLAYQEIVDLADSGRSKQALHSITYHWRGTGDLHREGMVTPGQTLELAPGMVIAAMVTDNA